MPSSTIAGLNRRACSWPRLLLAAGLLLSACQVEEKGDANPAVLTLNPKYNRLHSHSLVRRVRVPTEANLDYAAYSKNVMLADPEWRALHPAAKITLGALSFGGKLEEVKPILDLTPLTDIEKSRPMAWTPVLDHLMKWNFGRTADLAGAYAAITGEKWGDTSDIALPYQEFASVYIHSRGNVKEVWVELELKPWLNSFLDGIEDRDQDGYPEILARLSPRLITDEMVQEILGDYSSKALMEPQVLDWAQNLASRWYPSYNTDLLETSGGPWPYADVPEQARRELRGFAAENPLVIMKGRPFADTLFWILQVDGMGLAKSGTARQREGLPVARGLDKGLSARLEAITAKIDREVGLHGGGDWKTWNAKLAPFREQIGKLAAQEAESVLGLMAEDKTLVFRRELEYLAAPDWKSPESRQHPLAAIAAFKDYLAGQGIDFLFVPIPTKLDVYPELVSPEAEKLPGHIAQPHYRMVLKDLAEARVETVDLLEPFLKFKSASEPGKRPLYQRQDTHWTTLGLESAAQILAERIRLFSWHDQAFADRREYALRDTTFENLGDIQARLSDAKKAGVGPEELRGRQVVDAQGQGYQDEDSAQVLILGDSFTGVYQTVGCRHAGVTAHLARQLGGPVDLIMGWGGGPEAPQKLRKRGDAYLDRKRLVVWMMSVRDLFVYPGEWSLQ